MTASLATPQALRALAAAAAIAGACGGGRGAGSAPRPDGPPVAVVGAATIDGAAVAAEMRREGRPAGEALRALVDFELLCQAAARSIGEDDKDVEDARRR